MFLFHLWTWVRVKWTYSDLQMKLVFWGQKSSTAHRVESIGCSCTYSTWSLHAPFTKLITKPFNHKWLEVSNQSDCWTACDHQLFCLRLIYTAESTNTKKYIFFLFLIKTLLYYVFNLSRIIWFRVSWDLVHSYDTNSSDNDAGVKSSLLAYSTPLSQLMWQTLRHKQMQIIL